MESLKAIIMSLCHSPKEGNRIRKPCNDSFHFELLRSLDFENMCDKMSVHVTAVKVKPHL